MPPEGHDAFVKSCVYGTYVRDGEFFVDPAWATLLPPGAGVKINRASTAFPRSRLCHPHRTV
jgi:hypothetical protein